MWWNREPKPQEIRLDFFISKELKDMWEESLKITGYREEILLSQAIILAHRFNKARRDDRKVLFENEDGTFTQLV
jgi:hypothetical protein